MKLEVFLKSRYRLLSIPYSRAFVGHELAAHGAGGRSRYALSLIADDKFGLFQCTPFASSESLRRRIAVTAATRQSAPR
jgi:hypothetical protein